MRIAMVIFWILHVSMIMGQEGHLIDLRLDSGYLEGRTIQAYLPEDYYHSDTITYPVLYMMDGCNLFFDSTARFGMSWQIHEVIDTLSGADVEPFILIAVDNAGLRRSAEYFPQEMMLSLTSAEQSEILPHIEYSPTGDDFLEGLINDLIPFVDSNFRTRRSANSRWIGGSSRGGLISLYALCKYPDYFEGAICMSTHWTIAMNGEFPEIAESVIDYFIEKIPTNKKFYFDRGDRGLDQYYGVWQKRIDNHLQETMRDSDFLSLYFPGHDHNELDWRIRLHVALKFAF